MRLATIAATVALALAPAAHASNLAGEANGAYIAHTWGGELGLGYRFNTDALPGFNITPTLGAFVYKGNNTAVAGYGRLEASYSLIVFEFGTGTRYDTLAEKVRPYGTVSFSLAPWIGVKANGWKDYYSLGFTINY